MAFRLTQAIMIAATSKVRNPLQQVLTQVSTIGLVSIGTLALAHPAQAASLDLTTWGKFGDVSATSARATLTNAAIPSSVTISDDSEGGRAINRNVSGTSALFFASDSLEEALTLSEGALGLDAVEGSAIQTILNNVMAGDKFSFNWVFRTFDTDNIDRAFVTINDAVFNLAGTNPFSYTFTGAGNYRVAIGLVDVDDAIQSSILTVNNADFTAVPTPALLPGLIALGLRAGTKRRRAAN